MYEMKSKLHISKHLKLSYRLEFLAMSARTISHRRQPVQLLIVNSFFASSRVPALDQAHHQRHAFR